MGDQLYGLVAGGGCSHGIRDVPAGIAKVSSSGDWSIVADLSAYQATHHVAHPSPGDFEPDGTWYSMLHVSGKLFAVEPNHGEVVRVLPASGQVSRVVDVSATKGHIVPTALAERFGNLSFGNLGVFPIEPGSEKVFQLARNGTLTLARGGFTTVLGLDYDAKGRMYVLDKLARAGVPDAGRRTRRASEPGWDPRGDRRRARLPDRDPIRAGRQAVHLQQGIRSAHAGRAPAGGRGGRQSRGGRRVTEPPTNEAAPTYESRGLARAVGV